MKGRREPEQRSLFDEVGEALFEAADAMDAHAAARDAALDALEEKRSRAVALARATAIEIAAVSGTVTSAQVLARMRVDGHGPLLDAIDRRFMGAVFRRGWVRQGWVPEGSHKRPIPVWRRA